MRPVIIKPAAGKKDMASSVAPSTMEAEGELLSEAEFRRAIRREKGRTERSRSPFILMLVDAGPVLQAQSKVLPEIRHALARSMRATDFVGWYASGSVLGVIYTEVAATGVTRQAETLLGRAKQALASELTPELAARIGLSLHICPEDEPLPGMGPVRLASPIDEEMEADNHAVALAIKRVMDIAGSLCFFRPCWSPPPSR
jgi:hypothetical protein